MDVAFHIWTSKFWCIEATAHEEYGERISIDRKRREFVKGAFLESVIERLFQLESHIEHAQHLKLCTLIFVV